MDNFMNEYIASGMKPGMMNMPGMKPGMPNMKTGVCPGSYGPAEYGTTELNPYQINKMLEPVVERGEWEAQMYGIKHAIREAAFTAYLMGKGIDEKTAHSKVEGWQNMGYRQ